MQEAAQRPDGERQDHRDVGEGEAEQVVQQVRVLEAEEDRNQQRGLRNHLHDEDADEEGMAAEEVEPGQRDRGDGSRWPDLIPGQSAIWYSGSPATR